MFYCALSWTLPDHMPLQCLQCKFIGYNWHNIIIVDPIETRTDTRNHFHIIARLIFLLKELFRCFPRNVSNVLTEDQCKWLSTKWFIHLKTKQKTAVTQGHYESLFYYVYQKQQTPHSIGRLSSFIVSGMSSSLFSSHGFPISADSFYQDWAGWALFSPFLQTGSGKLWIQAVFLSGTGTVKQMCELSSLSPRIWTCLRKRIYQCHVVLTGTVSQDTIFI